MLGAVYFLSGGWTEVRQKAKRVSPDARTSSRPNTTARSVQQRFDEEKENDGEEKEGEKRGSEGGSGLECMYRTTVVGYGSSALVERVAKDKFRFSVLEHNTGGGVMEKHHPPLTEKDKDTSFLIGSQRPRR